MAYGSTIGGIAMQLTSTTAQHAMEHAMSAYHPNLPHGAGLIMISKAFSEFFIEKHACDGQFIKMAVRWESLRRTSRRTSSQHW